MFLLSASIILNNKIPSRLALELHCGYSKVAFNYLQDNNIFFSPDFMVSQLEVEDDAKMNIYRHLGYFLDNDSIQLMWVPLS